MPEWLRPVHERLIVSPPDFDGALEILNRERKRNSDHAKAAEILSEIQNIALAASMNNTESSSDYLEAVRLAALGILEMPSVDRLYHFTSATNLLRIALIQENIQNLKLIIERVICLIEEAPRNDLDDVVRECWDDLSLHASVALLVLGRNEKADQICCLIPKDSPCNDGFVLRHLEPFQVKPTRQMFEYLTRRRSQGD